MRLLHTLPWIEKEKIMKVCDLLKVLDTDSIIIADTDGNVYVDAESPYIEMASKEYRNQVVEKIVPLNNEIEITIRRN